MHTEKFQTGAFVFTRTRGLEPRDPSDLHDLASQHGMPELVPAYAGDRVAFTRAITATSRGLHREGFLLRPIRRTSTEVIYGIVKEEHDDERLDLDHEATVSWSAELDGITGDHPIARRVAESYAHLRGCVVADDWSSTITAYLEAHDAARMRGDGRVYWVPPQRLDDIRRLGTFLADVGIDVMMCELEPEAQGIVEDVARESLLDELDRLQEEAAAFDGKQKPSTYSRRLDEYQRLRERAGLYRDALGVGVDTATRVLAELETKVGSMLDLRSRTTIHRDGSVTGPDSSSSRPPVEPEVPVVPVPNLTPAGDCSMPAVTEGFPSRAPAGISFAGASFALTADQDGVLVYVSDEEPAKRSAASLESMGIAGKWQQAGPLRLNVQNSGPPGAAVSLRIEVPEGLTLEGTSSALRGWGIEVQGATP